jgi:hypothetical protein
MDPLEKTITRIANDAERAAAFEFLTEAERAEWAKLLDTAFLVVQREQVRLDKRVQDKMKA